MLMSKIKPNPRPIYENRFVFKVETFHDKNEHKSKIIATMFVAKIICLINFLNPLFLFFAGIKKLSFFF